MKETYTSGEFVGEGGCKDREAEVVKEGKRKDVGNKDESNDL